MHLNLVIPIYILSNSFGIYKKSQLNLIVFGENKSLFEKLQS